MKDRVDGLFREMFPVTNFGGADFVHAISAKALLKEVMELGRAVAALEADVKTLREREVAWKCHAEHLSRGESGKEKTIGWAFFNPRQHCSICKEA